MSCVFRMRARPNGGRAARATRARMRARIECRASPLHSCAEYAREFVTPPFRHASIRVCATARITRGDRGARRMDARVQKGARSETTNRSIRLRTTAIQWKYIYTPTVAAVRGSRIIWLCINSPLEVEIGSPPADGAPRTTTAHRHTQTQRHHGELQQDRQHDHCSRQECEQECRR
jgi:hypothetical protein